MGIVGSQGEADEGSDDVVSSLFFALVDVAPVAFLQPESAKLVEEDGVGGQLDGGGLDGGGKVVDAYVLVIFTSSSGLLTPRACR